MNRWEIGDAPCRGWNDCDRGAAINNDQAVIRARRRDRDAL